jgi:hypothetical protein
MKASAKQAKMYPKGLLFALLLAALAFAAGRFSVHEPAGPLAAPTQSTSASPSVELRINSADVRVLPDASIELPPLPALDIDLQQTPSAGTKQADDKPRRRTKKSMDKTGR